MSEVLHLTKPFSDRSLPIYRVSGRTLVVLRSFLKALGVPASIEKKIAPAYIFLVPSKNDAKAVTLETCRMIIKQFCSKLSESDQKLAIDQLVTDAIVESESSDIPIKKRDRSHSVIEAEIAPVFDKFKQEFITAFAPLTKQREELDESNKKIKILEMEVVNLHKALEAERAKRIQAEQMAIEKNPFNLATFKFFNKSQ